MTHLENADGQGQLLIGDRLSPVTYHVTVESVGRGFAVTADLHAARDWLIKQGFKRRATLVLASGDRAEIVHDDDIDVADSLSIVLKTERLTYDGAGLLLNAFPELASPPAPPSSGHPPSSGKM